MTSPARLREMVGEATPGPLEVVLYGDGNSLVIHEKGTDNRICFMATPARVSDMRRIEANADLIVAMWDRFPHLLDEIENLKTEAELFDDDHADQNRMVDRIADLIGIPHDQEPDTTAFELWFSAQASLADARDRRIAELEAALRAIRNGAEQGKVQFRERLEDRKKPTWWAVNALQDHLSASGGHARAALEARS